MRVRAAIISLFLTLGCGNIAFGQVEYDFTGQADLTFRLGQIDPEKIEASLGSEEREFSNEASIEIEDLLAQKAMAYWAKISGLLGILTALVSASAVIMASKSLNLAQNIAKRQLSPYVHAVSGEFGNNNNIILKIRNDGQTPAMQFCVNATSQIVKRGEVSKSIKFIHIGYKAWSTLGVGHHLNVSILDNDSTISDFRKSCEPANVMFGGLDTQQQQLLICGKVIYLGVSGEAFLTEFAFFVDRSSKRFRRPTSLLKSFSPIQTSEFKKASQNSNS